MSNDTSDSSVVSGLKSWKILIPIVLGLGVTGIMFYREYEPGIFDTMQITAWSIVWIILSFMMMATRDVGYMLRLRILSDKELSWRQSFRVIMLWEFASAVTPSAVGGTGVAVFFVNAEGISGGRSTGIVMVTSFLDELFFAIVFPIAVLLIGHSNIFDFSSDIGSHLMYIAWIGYGIKVTYLLLLSYGFFINPQGLKKLLVLIFKLPFIRRWSSAIDKIGNDMISTAEYFRAWSFTKWIKAFAATVASWIARYWVVNTLIVAFLGINYLGLTDHFIVFGKQLAMWIMMLVMPTPGGSGFAEWVFSECFANLSISVMALALCWRIVSYYPYLIMGAIVVPKWVKRILNNRKNDSKAE